MPGYFATAPQRKGRGCGCGHHPSPALSLSVRQGCPSREDRPWLIHVTGFGDTAKVCCGGFPLKWFVCTKNLSESLRNVSLADGRVFLSGGRIPRDAEDIASVAGAEAVKEELEGAALADGQRCLPDGASTWQGPCWQPRLPDRSLPRPLRVPRRGKCTKDVDFDRITASIPKTDQSGSRS